MIPRLGLWRNSMCFVLLATCAFSRPGIADTSTHSYVDSRFGYSLRFPVDTLVTVGHGNLDSSPVYNYDPITQRPAIVIELNPASTKGTNFGSAGVYVALSTDRSIVLTCTKAAVGEQRALRPLKLDGVRFARFGVDDGGAGTLLHWNSYRAVHDKACYEIVEWISWGNMGNYDPGTIKEFDKGAIEKQLSAIRQSFKFRRRSHWNAHG